MLLHNQFEIDTRETVNTAPSYDGEQAVFAVFYNKTDLHDAVSDLKDKDFAQDEIFTHFFRDTNLLDEEKESLIGKFLIAGAIIGSALGSIVCMYIKYNILLFMNSYPSDPKSKMIQLLVGAIIGGMVLGSLGAIIGFFIPEEQKPQENYEYQNIGEGCILLKVQVTDSQVANVNTLLKDHGGRIISLTDAIHV